MKSWFAAQTLSRHEQLVRGGLGQRQIEAFLPTVSRWSRWKDRKKRIDWPLFPGYCFARFGPGELLNVLKCTGVVTVVSFAGRPAPIPDSEIQGIRLLLSSDVNYDSCPLLKEGMMVEVMRGPLTGVKGRLVRRGAQSRLILAVALLNCGFSAEVDACDVESIGWPTTSSN
jgi:transcription termination/antitermination protein NusG